MNLPHIQLYPGDWLKDPVAGCSLAAQGLWLRMMFIMQESVHRGYLCHPDENPMPDFCQGKTDGKLKPLPEEYLAKRAGATIEEFRILMAELWSFGVPSKTENGVIYSRRMVRDEALRKVRSKAGARGAESYWSRQKEGAYLDFAKAKPMANCDNDIDNDNDNGTSTSLNGRLYGIPSTPEEVMDFGKTLTPPVDQQTCRDFFNYYEGQRKTNPEGKVFWATGGGTVVTHWRSKLPSFSGQGKLNGFQKPVVKADHSKGF